jgi:hypothetical protein
MQPGPDPFTEAAEPALPPAAPATAGDGDSGNTTEPSTGLNGLSAALGLEAAGDVADPLPGMVVGGVRIVRLIGEGGMGRVYEGWQEQPARRVAVKVMRPGLASAEALRRFHRESEILGQLDHPGIARIFAAGSFDLLGAAIPYYVMEFLPRARTIVSFADAAGLSLDDRLAIFAHVCDAVGCGHSRGVVHRDLKPANLLVDAAGRPRVIDFGVARWRDEAAVAPTTVTGQFIGTLQYMSPEQCAGRPDAVDARADVYALGVVLYELVVGHPPYDIRDLGPLEAARIVCEREPPPPSRIDRRIPRRIDRIVGRCLRKDPAARFADAAALAAAIRDPAIEPARPRRAWLVAGAAGLAVAITLASLAARGGPPREATTTFDLRQPPGGELVRATNARIYREPFGAVTYWAPIQQREWAEVVYRLDAPFPVAAVVLDRFRVDAWNLHNDVPFDREAAVHLEISPDGETWTEVMSSTPAGGRRENGSFAAAVRDARRVFFRARLYETNSWNRNQVHRAQFLRSEPDRGAMPSVTLADRPR